MAKAQTKADPKDPLEGGLNDPKNGNADTKPEKPEKPKKDVVEIPKAQWEAILTGMSDLRRDNEMLKQIADKGRLAAFQDRQNQPLASFVKLSTYEFKGERKLVLAWQMTKDRVYKAPNGVWVEEQEVTITLEDDINVTLSLADFYRLTASKMKAEVTGTGFVEGQKTLKLKTETGKELEIDVRFVN